MTEYRYLVTYKGGPFVKTVYANDQAKADAAIADRYDPAKWEGNRDFKVIRLLDPDETDPTWTDPHYRGGRS